MIATSQFTISIVNDGAPGSQGPRGISITATKEQWYLSDSKTSLTGGSWSYTEPETIPEGKYLWGRIETTMSDSTKQYSDAVYRSVIGGIKDIVDSDHLAITSEVWQSDITNSINSYDGTTTQAIRDRLTTTETNLSGITTRVSDVETTTSSLGTRMTQAESSITQNANKIALMVSVDGTSSSLTLTNNMLEAITDQFVIKDPAGSATIISGGKIHANAITTAMLATNAIKSTNYDSGVAGSDTPASATHYVSNTGTFLDLATGNLYTPNFSLTAGEAYLNGQIKATSGQIGEEGSSYWEIGTNFDSSWTDRAALIAHGNSLIQTGKFTLSNDRLNSLNGGNYIHVLDENNQNWWYDFGVQVPDPDATGQIDGATHKKNFLYIRRINTEPDVNTLDSSWSYLFRVENNGDIYWNGHNISGGTYLPLSGGTLTGDLTAPNITVTGVLTGTATAANRLSTPRTIQTNLSSTSSASFDGSANVTPGVTGTLGVGNGGTGKSTWTANRLVYSSATNALSELAAGNSGQVLKSNGTSAPTWVDQSTLSVGSATKATQDGNGDVITATYRKLDDSEFDSINVTDMIAGNLIVNGVARFTNGLYGDIIGQATSVSNNLTIQLNGGTTEGTNKFTYNGSAAKTVNITKSSIGLGNVENTALSTWAGSTNLTTTKVGTLAGAAVKAVDTSISASSTSGNLPTSAAVATFVENKGYVTSSGVTSVTLTAGDGISINNSGTAITTTGTRTITNTGVRSISESTANGKISVNTGGTTTDVAVHGLGTWAYKSSGTASDVGLENVTNDAQVKGIAINNTTIEDSGVYKYRAVPQTLSAMKIEFDTIVGGSVAWNQLVEGKTPSAPNWTTRNGTLTAGQNESTYTVETIADGINIVAAKTAPANHVYLFAIEVKPAHSKRVTILIIDYRTNRGGSKDLTAGTWGAVTCISKVSSETGLRELQVFLRCTAENGYSVGDEDNVRNFMCIDLTQMLGPNVADVAYSKEQSSAGSGIAWLKSAGFIDNNYHPYNPGELKSVEGLVSHEMVGFNQWDEEWELGYYDAGNGNKTNVTNEIRSKNLVRVLPNTAYYGTGFLSTASCVYFDADENYVGWGRPIGVFTTPNNAYYMALNMGNNYGTTYKNDLCINLSQNDRNGEYEPYVKHSYPLDSSLTLRGIPKINQSGDIYYDGDIYHSDGTVERKYAEVDMGTLTWTYDSASGTMYAIKGAQYKGNAGNVQCAKYPVVTTISGGGSWSNIPDKTMYSSSGYYVVHDSAYTNAATFKAAMSGVMLIYELATPTTESATPYASRQLVDGYGTEEYVTNSDISIPVPVGHTTQYVDYTLAGNLVEWGIDGYTVKDSGISKSTIVKSVASDNDGRLVLTYADGSTSDPIEVSFVATETSSVSMADALNVNGTAIGSATQPVYFDNQGKPQTANKIPKLNNASSDSAFYAPTTAGTSGQYLKSTGGTPTWETFSKSTVGLGNVDNTADANKNVLTATKFSSTRKIELTGDTTGSDTKDGSSGWSIATTTKYITGTAETSTALVAHPGDGKIRYSYMVNNGTTGLFNATNNANSIITISRFPVNSGTTSSFNSQIGLSSDTNVYYRCFNGTDLDNTTAWKKFLDSTNYTDYTVTKTGTGATGTWGINISGNATTATTATTSNSLKSLARATNLDVDNTDDQYKNKVTYMLAARSTTTGKPPAEGGVLNFGWDGDKWGAQLAISINTTPHLYLRGNNNSDWDASWLTVLDSNNFNTYAPKKDGTGATGTWGISISGSATKATQDSDGNAINTTYAKLSGATFTGAVTGTSFGATGYLSANSGNSLTTAGLALYSTDPNSYGIALRSTGNKGVHGYVSGDAAIYSFISAGNSATSKTRGWVLRNSTDSANVASVSGAGNAVFNGSVTIGGNAANTSGMRMEYDETLGCTNFIFN